MDSNDLQTIVFVLIIPRIEIRKRTNTIDTTIGQNIYQDYFLTNIFTKGNPLRIHKSRWILNFNVGTHRSGRHFFFHRLHHICVDILRLFVPKKYAEARESNHHPDEKIFHRASLKIIVQEFQEVYPRFESHQKILSPKYMSVIFYPFPS